MARLNPRHRPGVDLIYPMAQRLVDDCLARDGSLFTPELDLWTIPVLRDFHDRFVKAPSTTGSFMSQFEAQLKGAAADTVQLAAELVYVYLLPVVPTVIGVAKKREILETVLSWSDRAVSIPDDALSALDGGLLKPGQNYSTQRHRQISWLTRFLLYWKALPAEDRAAGLKDPWKFRDQVRETAAPRDRGEGERRVLLHLVHPDTFEAIIAKDHLAAIPLAFLDPTRAVGDPDRDILAARSALEPEYGTEFDFYRSPVHELWSDRLPAGKAGGIGIAAPDIDEDAASEPDAPRSLAALADELLLDAGFLSEVVELLEDKRQIVFYGPPGTGKTYIARALAGHLGATEGSVDIVQLHPSYSYEDFVEGYRPTESGGFAVVWGPLRRLADKAEKNPGVPHVLVIDEINRGNVAKVFGELYYLLEYRGDRITLQYSAEPFRLPENLWIIGTMNTADRSIALLDSALRRRFYFIELSPSVPPVSQLLRKWLDRTGKTDLTWVADVVARANTLLGDRHAAIGPSYFMRDELDEAWVGRIWRHAVEPYLAEHFFGEEHRLAEFALDRLQTEVGAGDMRSVTQGGLSATEEAPTPGMVGQVRSRTAHSRTLTAIPDGTIISFRDVHARIKGGQLIFEDGRSFVAPSPAASAVSGTSLNGWQTWIVDGAIIETGDGHRAASLADLHDSPEDIAWPSPQ